MCKGSFESEIKSDAMPAYTTVYIRKTGSTFTFQMCLFTNFHFMMLLYLLLCILHELLLSSHNSFDTSTFYEDFGVDFPTHVD
jgi:hypothetical protein